MNHLFVVLATLLLFVLGGTASIAYLRMAGRRGNQWSQLISRLAPVDRSRIASIALAGPRSSEDSETGYFGDLESELWFQEVGWKGLDQIKNNCAVMIDMAHFIQSTYPEAVVTAEQLRVSARQVEWYIDRLRLASHAGHLEACFAEYADRAIGLYYGMTESLKTVYRERGVPERDQLEAVL